MDTNDKTNYRLQVDLVTDALKALGHGQHKASEIKSWIEEKHKEEFQRLQRSWGPYLSAATQDPSTGIERTPGRFTYTLRPIAPAVLDQTGESSATGSVENRTYAQKQDREARVYRPLATWLRSRGFLARVTADGKKGGIWGNPDVTGIKVVEGLLGQKVLEVSTIEAKLSSSDWKRVFFEAVAHKRFSQRAYFAFAHGTDEPSLSEIAEADEMREYGEKYGIGVLVVFAPAKAYTAWKGADLSDTALELEDLRIEELWPAIYDPVRPSAMNVFLKDVLELTTDEHVYGFDDE